MGLAKLKSLILSLLITLLITIFNYPGLYPKDSSKSILRVRLFYLIQLKKLIFQGQDHTFQMVIRDNDRGKRLFSRLMDIEITFLSDQSIVIMDSLKAIYTGSWKSIEIHSPAGEDILVGNRIIVPRAYHGQFLVQRYDSHGNHRIHCVNLVPINAYLKSVVSAEMAGITKSIDSLKAQAVVSRSYALASLKRHGIEGYQFCDTTHCQVYFGKKIIMPIASQAVDQTRNELIAFNQLPVPAYYHSTCGGRTTTPRRVWGSSNLDYMSGVGNSDNNRRDYCFSSPHYRWKTKVKKQIIRSVFLKHRVFSDSLKFSRIVCDPSGRILRMVISSGQVSKSLSGEAFRIAIGRIIGWSKIKSSAFIILSEDHDSFYFKGKGLGHGVGLCQYGAARMGESGLGYRAILKHYFPEAHIH